MTTRLSSLILVSLLLISSAGSLASGSAGAKDADLTLNVNLNDRILMSDESFQAVFSASGLSNTDTYILTWNLKEGNTTQGTSLASDTIYFQPSGSNHYKTLEVWHFSTDSHLYLLTATLEKAGEPTSAVSISEKFSVFRKMIAPDWDDLILFGDSLTDTGNAYRDWGTPESPPYFGGRFTNGNIWLEGVHDWLGINTVTAQGSNAGNNRAYGGATTANGYYLWVIPNVGKQVDDYTGSFDIGSGEVVGLWAGGNDVRNGADSSQELLNNINEHAEQLISDGAERVILFEIPPIDRIPEFRDNSDEDKAAKASVISDFNSAVVTLATTLAAQHSVDVSVIPVWGAFEEAYWNPSAFGFDNVTHSACQHDGITCDSNDPIDPVPNRFIFFDNKHPTAPIHRLLSLIFREAVGVSDYDGDGMADTEDGCDDTMPGGEIDSMGCPPPVDSDGDGVLDPDDDCQNTPTDEQANEAGCSLSQLDSDGDGVSDATDQCPETTPVGVTVDAWGCSETQADYDFDGIANAFDQCPGTQPERAVDDNGCSAYQRDSDDDGIFDAFDSCPGTAAAEEVDASGCAAYQRDSDGDGVADAFDECAWTSPEEAANDAGCGESQRDSDGDGFVDSDDLCAGTPEGEEVDRNGCGPSQRDTDGDGLNDSAESCPETPGSLDGCPAVSVSLELLQEISEPGMARIAMTLSCEGGCRAEVVVGDEVYGRISEGTHLLMVNVVDGQTVIVTASFGSSTAEDELTIVFLESEAEPQPEPQPEPEAQRADETVDMTVVMAIAALVLLLSAVIIMQKPELLKKRK